MIAQAAVLPEGGSRTPLLLSKEIMRWLGCSMDMSKDQLWCSKIGQKIQMRETDRGHYAIPVC